MCGRYRLSRRKQPVEEYFDSVGEDDWTPRYNVAPTQPVPIIRQNPKEPRRELSLVRWGLIPWWAKDQSGSAMMINARSETAATKPAFRDALKLRRCLVLHEYGGPEKLKFEDNLPEPQISGGMVLISAAAASVNPIDWKMRSGMRQKDFPLSFPAILGRDVSGVVRAVGANVKHFKPGDRVLALPTRPMPSWWQWTIRT